MISRQLRERLTYTAMSVFVAWHTVALVLTPAPNNNALAQSFRRLFHPYLTLFKLDNKWDFYAPEVGKGRQFRYDIEDAAGKHHTFVPSAELNWFLPHYWWFGAWYDAIVDDPDSYADQFAALLCRKHAALHPVSITFKAMEEQDFTPEDHRSGKHPMDAEFVVENILKHVPCPAS